MRFFFYGTLLDDAGNDLARRVRRLLGPGMPAITRGRLIALPDPAGWYPALLPATEGPAVHGRLFDAALDPADLAALDAYEDCWPDHPDRSEYLRRDIAVTTAVGRGTAQAYCYNQPLPPGAEAIPDGCFAPWLQRHGRCGFRA